MTPVVDSVLSRLRHRSLKARIALASTLGLFILVSNANPSMSFGEWETRVSQLTWVAYSPSSSDPVKGVEASEQSIREDLTVLRKIGFTGLVTYGASGVMGRELPLVAQSMGFSGIILGVWDPTDEAELDAAKSHGKTSIVLGFCVGNEGLGKRYDLSKLSRAIQELRKATGKPVTTTEEIDDYSNANLLDLGDWVFPNVHPYFHNLLDPPAAVRWTKAAYDDLRRRTSKFVLLKEVGLPTAGDSQRKLSEKSQEQFYTELAKTVVRFVYFEAFDQLWKNQIPVEPHWGIFRADRSPKQLALRLTVKSARPKADTKKATAGSTRPDTADPLYVYYDAESPRNRFSPSGYMGDAGDIEINYAYTGNRRSGRTCIQVVYKARGNSPNKCDNPPPCKWAGLYWLEPPNNWGIDALFKDKGINLSGYNKLLFWARSDKPCVVEFKVGGINQPYGDSLAFPRSLRANITKEWQLFELSLKDADLNHLIGGFCWVSNWDDNPEGTIFYLDDIHYAK
jgi:exo-beta-1,3-glucanase (GH17 family)